MKYRKKPVVIEAMQMPPEGSEVDEKILNWLNSSRGRVWSRTGAGSLAIHTLEGDMTASPLDWIIKGVSGEFYPCKPDIFEQTYDEVKQ